MLPSPGFILGLFPCATFGWGAAEAAASFPVAGLPSDRPDGLSLPEVTSSLSELIRPKR
jgi:hypothetical protein